VTDEFHGFVSTNLKGFIFITRLAVKRMLSIIEPVTHG